MLKTGDVLELRPAKKVWHHRWALWLPCGMVYGLQLDSVGMVYMLAPITLVHDDIIKVYRPPHDGCGYVDRILLGDADSLVVAERVCHRCGKPVEPSYTGYYKYQCMDCDEDLYCFETELKFKE